MNTDDLYRLLRASHVEAQGIVDTVADPMLVLDEALRVQNGSRAFFETFKVDRFDTIGRPLNELGNGQWDSPELRRLLLEVIPKSSALIDFEVEHEFPGLGKRKMLLTARRLRHPDHHSHSLLLVIVDVTERARREEAKDLLVGELRHRMKNLLGLIQSIARQTPVANRSATDYQQDFLGRFRALAEAQELAFNTEVGGLATLIKRVVAPYASNPDTVAIEGSSAVPLDSKTLLDLGLVLHELATNAAKHGALSSPSGKVRITWQVTDDQKLRLSWVESGGPPVTPPKTTGFGTTVIESALKFSQMGQVEQRFERGGLEVDLVVPIHPPTHEEHTSS